MTAEPTERVLSGWGRTNPSSAQVVLPDGPDGVAQLLGAGVTPEPMAASRQSAALGDRAGGRPLIARGLGRSYGDAAQCAGGTVIETTRLDAIGPIDPRVGTVEVGGGASLGDLMRRALLTGWFVPVTPGTRHVTVGGAIAADVHGKNHHRDGSFCRYVTNLTLVTPTGTHVVGPHEDAALFWATAGGMGLTGVITKATLQLIPVESAWMLVDTARFDRLDELMAVMSASDADHRYSVAWLDLAGRRRDRGRSVLTRGEHAPLNTLPPALRGRRPTRHRDRSVRPPTWTAGHLLTPGLVRTMNSLWFRKAPRRETSALRTVSSFFHPLDGVAGWNLLYGKRGFVQYQFVVGSRHAHLVHDVIGLIGSYKVPCFLAVLKRLGPGNRGPLSFPTDGWTLALDFPVGPDRLWALLDRLDELVAAAGGRVYLAKDSRLRPELFSLMYPRFGELADVRDRVDPQRKLQSDLSRRLGLDRRCS